MSTTTATKPLTATDLEEIIAATERTIEALTAVEAKLATAVEAHTIASAAVIAMGLEEAAAAEIAQAEQAAQLEADWTAKQAELDEALRDFAHLLDDLVVGVKVALKASAELYNLGVAKGIHGNSLGTRNYIEGRVGHVLHLEAGLTQFDLARGTGRDPIGDPTPRHIPPQAEPLPERRDTRDMENGYAGQNQASRRIIKTELRNAAGDWIEVPIGSFDWPTEPYVAPTADEVTTADLEAEAAQRQARHRKQDADARKRGKAAPKVPGEN